MVVRDLNFGLSKRHQGRVGALSGAVKKGDEDLIDALICGYNYFILFNKCVSDNVASLIEMLAQFEQIL